MSRVESRLLRILSSMAEPVVDCAFTLEQTFAGKEFPQEIRDSLTLLDVQYVSFDGLVHQGQLVVHQDTVEDLAAVFARLLEIRFPIKQVVPIVAYDWDDDHSMADNNSSAFNYRTIACSDRLSNHSYGLAVDINPFLNPYQRKDGLVVPEGSRYDPSVPGTLVAGEEPVTLFLERGWDWGGLWKENVDWQHFAKAPR